MESPKLRILSLVTNLVMGGDAVRLLNFARALDHSRFEHTVLTLVPPDHEENRPFGLLKPEFDRYHIPLETLSESPRSQRRQTQHGLPLLWGDAVTFTRVLRRLNQYLRRHRVDIVDARMTYATLFGVLAGRLAGVPVIVSTCYGPDDDKNWSEPVRYAVVRKIFSQVDAVISDSRWAIDGFQRWAVFPHHKTVVIPNGIFPPAAECERAEVRRFFELPDDPELRVVGQVSRLIPYKGHRVLLSAARQVLDREPNTAFLLCGHAHLPQYMDELRRLACELGIADRVRIGGYPGPIGDVWRAIDIHVHASLLDSSPIAIHESMALGLPAVVTDVGGIPELVRAGETALVVPAGEDRSLAEALLRILRDPALGQSLGMLAKRRFYEHYQAACMTRALEHLFSTLYAKRRGHMGRGLADAHV